MDLRAWIYSKSVWFKKTKKEWIYCTLLWGLHPVAMSDKNIEKKERLIQTYIVLFGLIISYDADVTLQKEIISNFIWFVISSLSYYFLLGNIDRRVFAIMANIIAVSIAYHFTVSINALKNSVDPLNSVLIVSTTSGNILFDLKNYLPEMSACWQFLLFLSFFFSLAI